MHPASGSASRAAAMSGTRSSRCGPSGCRTTSTSSPGPMPQPRRHDGPSRIPCPLSRPSTMARTPMPLIVPCARCSVFGPHASFGSNGNPATGSSDDALGAVVTDRSRAFTAVVVRDRRRRVLVPLRRPPSAARSWSIVGEPAAPPGVGYRRHDNPSDARWPGRDRFRRPESRATPRTPRPDRRRMSRWVTLASTSSAT
jgi:hypothetical protein